MRNIAASIRQKLLNKAREEKRPFSELLQYYAMERFLYRLSISRHKDCFILKGGLMLRVWDPHQSRPTMDIDLLGKTSNDDASIVAQIKDILVIEVIQDGVIFLADSIASVPIAERADYVGLRVSFRGFLDTAHITMQLDICFGDSVFPEPEKLSFPVILDSPIPIVFCYSKESVIAEKLHAMVKLGLVNSRMKDFYDIWILSRRFSFDHSLLKQAIEMTFKERSTDIPANVTALTDDFCTAKQKQWTAFRKRINQDFVPENMKDVIRDLQEFLLGCM